MFDITTIVQGMCVDLVMIAFFSIKAILDLVETDVRKPFC